MNLIRLSFSFILLINIISCSDESHNIKQPKKKPSYGADPASLPPKYLKIKDFKQCLGQTKPKTPHDATFWCLPSEKPNRCPDTSWEQIKKEFKNNRCD